MPSKKLLETFVAGLIYGDLDVDNLKLKKGQRLRLVAEPENLHDDNAIKIMLGKRKVGYIPREETFTLHDYKEAGIALRCIVKQVAKTNATHRMVLIEVTAQKEMRTVDFDQFKSY